MSSTHFWFSLNMSVTCLVPAGLTGQLYSTSGTGQKDPAAGFAHQVAVRTLRQSGARLQKTAPIRSKITKNAQIRSKVTKHCANQEQGCKKLRQSGARLQKMRKSGARLQKTAPIRSKITTCVPIRSKITKLRQSGARFQNCANQE